MNLYTGPNTEDTPTIVEAAAFKSGIVVAQVNEVVDKVSRVDIPGDQVDFIVKADKPFYVEPLFTRDPASVTETQILMAMMAIKGIYAEYGVKLLNHGIGFPTASIELLLPTYGERLGLKGKVATHWALNPHPTLIPAIETGWVEQIHSFGGEVGMEDYKITVTIHWRDGVQKSVDADLLDEQPGCFMEVVRHKGDHFSSTILHTAFDERAVDGSHEHAVWVDAVIELIAQHRIAGDPCGLIVVESEVLDRAGGRTIRQRLEQPRRLCDGHAHRNAAA